ncbi:MAG: hypothetical protein EXS39_02270 [Opitutaceae bacterium]|nr:hypothetical protein [Opitutaceae bacterium]
MQLVQQIALGLRLLELLELRVTGVSHGRFNVGVNLGLGIANELSKAVRIRTRVEALLTGGRHYVQLGGLSLGEEALEFVRLLGRKIEVLEERGVAAVDHRFLLDGHQALHLGLVHQRPDGGECRTLVAAITAVGPIAAILIAARTGRGISGHGVRVIASPIPCGGQL